ncbi:MAG: zinc-dependent metalloprotease [Balneolaceae bacterium]
MELYEGFFNFWWDDHTGSVWLEVNRVGEEFIYVNALAAGLGSNDVGLDRSQLGDTRVVYFQKTGPRLYLVQPNYSFRASSNNPLEQKSVQEAFAQSILWGFDIEVSDNGRHLINITDFLLRDAHGVVQRLQSRGQGSFSPDKSRSAIHLPGTFNFPKNSEFEASITYAGNNPGGEVRSVTPTPEAVTLRQHHSFVELPDDGYKPRIFDPRAGYFGISYQDYSSPIGEPLTQRYIARHRLEKVDPTADISEAKEPIIFYLDNGTPEPVRTALLEGARWWKDAFEAIGYKDAYRVEILPDDAHPLDIRYNVINWVHRSTRGWSYGSSVIDPRTGEIIKGNVLLGSLRVRQDYMIAEGLLAPYESGEEPDPEMLEMALDRIRQLSAHEVGHTLGIAHNFAASTNDLASVMDYPHPMASINPDGTLSLENAYDIGIGEWDKRAVAYGYQDFPDGANEAEELEAILRETVAMGLRFISDEAARPAGGAHPYAHLWDYGTDTANQLSHIMDIRRAALNQFGERTIRMGRPMSDLQDVLVPVYLFHRYQTEAAVKWLGGVEYAYTVRGDGRHGPRPVPAADQQRALEALLQTLTARELALPEHLLEQIPPQPARIPRTREHFRGYTDPILDPVAMAESAAGLTASLLFNENRAARLALQHARNSSFPGLHQVTDRVFNETVFRPLADGYHGAVERAINVAVVRNALQLAHQTNTAPDVQALLRELLSGYEQRLFEMADAETEQMNRAHYRMLGSWIGDHLFDPDSLQLPSAPYTPPGSPIGSGGFMDMENLHLHCSF